MPNIANMVDYISQLSSSYITVHQERCALVRNRNADCLKCAEVCTSGCISYEDAQIVISPEKCIGCGTCATACPTCALEAHHPNDAELLNKCFAAMNACEGHVTLACGTFLDKAAGLFDETKVVRVECLGRVEESALCVLAARGASEVTLVRGACDSCEHATGWAMAQLVAETERKLLDAWMCPMELRLTHKLPAETRRDEAPEYDETRRAVFEQSVQFGAYAGATAAEFALKDAFGGTEEASEAKPDPRYTKVMDDGTLPHFVPDRRGRLLDALATLGEPKDVMIDTRLWGHVIIDTEKCTSCRMCAVFCPTAALRKFQDADGTFGVEHYPGDCVKCRSCVSICPANALELSEEVFAREMLAGMTDRYEMKPRAVEVSTPHTILNTIKLKMKTDQVYER